MCEDPAQSVEMLIRTSDQAIGRSRSYFLHADARFGTGADGHLLGTEKQHLCFSHVTPIVLPF